VMNVRQVTVPSHDGEDGGGNMFDPIGDCQNWVKWKVLNNLVPAMSWQSELEESCLCFRSLQISSS
jgi:hypothetical protein